MSDEARDRRDRRNRDATGPVVRAIRSIGLRPRESHRGDDLATPPGPAVPTSIADRDTDRVEAADLPKTTPPELPAVAPTRAGSAEHHDDAP